jgi:predicted signal transduction protein with EAL and GGDEF domain
VANVSARPFDRFKGVAQGCDEMQGYLFSKPLPANEIETRFVRELIKSTSVNAAAVAICLLS